MITDKRIDGGKPFDWGRVSGDYARYRDIYPQAFYDSILRRGLCVNGQRVLDVGTGTGVLPRNMVRYGAHWLGTDISPEQIAQAIRLSEGLGIDYAVCPTEKLELPAHSFDVITACQCFWYFEHTVTAPLFRRLLKPDGRLLLLYMAWLPYEDPIAGASEQLVLRYHPAWSGSGERLHPIAVPAEYEACFACVHHEEFPLPVHFTREGWHGRMKACRGVGASLPEAQLALWEQEHRRLLDEIAPPEFDVLHYAALSEWKPLP